MPRENVIFIEPKEYSFEILPSEGHVIYGRVRLRPSKLRNALDYHQTREDFKRCYLANQNAAMDFIEQDDIDAYMICGEACLELLRKLETMMRDEGLPCQYAGDEMRRLENVWTAENGTNGAVPRRGQYGIFDICVQGFDYRVTFTPSANHGYDNYKFETLENGKIKPLRCPLDERGELSAYSPPEVTDKALSVHSAAIALALTKSSIPVHRCNQRNLF